MLQNVIENGRRSGAPKRFDKAWVKVLQDHLGAYKHAEFGLGTSTMQAQRYGYTQMINNAILTNSSVQAAFCPGPDALPGRNRRWIIDGFDLDAGKKHWLEDPIWQGTRKSIETIMGATDYLEQYFATNVIFEPLVGELFRSGFVMQMAACAERLHHACGRLGRAKATTSAISPTRSSCSPCWCRISSTASRNRQMLVNWAAAARRAGRSRRPTSLQPIWSQPRVKVAQFADALDQAKNRLRAIAAEIGFDARSRHRAADAYSSGDATMAQLHTDNIFKSMKDMKFEDTISHECGVTMNDSVESRAIAEVMAEKPGIRVTYMPAMIRIDGEGKIEFKMAGDHRGAWTRDDALSVRNLHLDPLRPHGHGRRRNRRAVR